MIALSFGLSLLVILFIGLLSATKSKKTTEDYLIAGKSVPAWLAGLSAVATNNSGYMFIGMIGVTYLTGLSSIWLMIGWILGDLMISLVAVRRIREVSNNPKIHSFGGLLAHWHGGNQKHLRRLAGLLIFSFLTLYAAAQLKAGSKATFVLLGWAPEVGIMIGAVIVLAYSIAGGIRASIWTDAVQSFMMIAGMALLMFMGLKELGGLRQALSLATEIQSNYLNWFPEGSALKKSLFVVGWFFGGVAVIGQPHIVIRFMGLSSTKKVNEMRLYYYTWFTLFYAATIIVGMLCRGLFPDASQFDSELALPQMAQLLFPPLLQGLLLAALFAATMSTADSLVLACSAAISRDFIDREKHSLKEAKIATFSVLVLATLIAVFGSRSVFRLVLDAWGLLASAFVPLIISYSLNWKIREKFSIAGVLLGIAVFIFWENSVLGALTYSVGPGIVAGFLFFVLVRVFGGNQKASA